MAEETALGTSAISCFFSRNSCPHARIISDGLEVEKQREDGTTKGAHTRFEPRALKFLQEKVWPYSTAPLRGSCMKPSQRNTDPSFSDLVAVPVR